jgi:hypothetical protein
LIGLEYESGSNIYVIYDVIGWGTDYTRRHTRRIIGSLIGVFVNPYFRYVEEIENFEKYILYPFVSASAEAYDYIKVYFRATIDEQETNRNKVSLSLDRLYEKTSTLHNSGLFIQLVNRGQNTLFFGSVAGLEFRLRNHREYRISHIEDYSNYLRKVEKDLNKCGKNQDKFDYKPESFRFFFCKRIKIFLGRK